MGRTLSISKGGFHAANRTPSFGTYLFENQYFGQVRPEGWKTEAGSLTRSEGSSSYEILSSSQRGEWKGEDNADAHIER
jgi:hypothetical protein